MHKYCSRQSQAKNTRNECARVHTKANDTLVSSFFIKFHHGCPILIVFICWKMFVNVISFNLDWNILCRRRQDINELPEPMVPSTGWYTQPKIQTHLLCTLCVFCTFAFVFEIHTYKLYTFVVCALVFVSKSISSSTTHQQQQQQQHDCDELKEGTNEQKKKIRQNEMRQQKNHLYARVHVVFAHCLFKSHRPVLASDRSCWRTRHLKWFAALFIYATEFRLLRRSSSSPSTLIFFFLLFLPIFSISNTQSTRTAMARRSRKRRRRSRRSRRSWWYCSMFATTGGYTRPPIRTDACNCIWIWRGVACVRSRVHYHYRMSGLSIRSPFVSHFVLRDGTVGPCRRWAPQRNL